MTSAGPASVPARPTRSSAGPVTLADGVQFLRGVGPRRAKALESLGILTKGDLLEYFPFRHERQVQKTIVNLELGETATIVGRVESIRMRGSRWFGRRGATVNAKIVDNTGKCSACWFNAPFMADRIQAGAIVRLTGRVAEFDERPQLVNPRVEQLDDSAAPADESRPAVLEPVYSGNAEMPARSIARLIADHLDDLSECVEEWYPPAFRAARDLPPRRTAIVRMHRPTREADLSVARRRLAYDELLAMQVAIQMVRRRRVTATGARPLALTEEIDARIRRRLPFVLTAGQETALREIVADLAVSRPMNRLLQGDVGCGKTAVAVYAALLAIARSCQVAIMAPTELLAEQLYANFDRYLAGSRVRRALLMGGMQAALRRTLLADLAAGRMDLVVGTQALVERDLRFHNLGLVIIDEQHRFGVRQRAVFRGKGGVPHYLAMTATPIPRTLAMTVFGDLDVTAIQGLPPGRMPIRTTVVPPENRESAWAFVRERIAAGEQAFVVYPLVDESAAGTLRAATAEHRKLAARQLNGIQVGLIHGRMRTDEKNRVMADFAARRTAVLVATTVVEVGIDVPAATVMVVEHADRYGLSQLHQLRGRVGRGDRPGHCLLMAGNADAANHARLVVLTRESDGFRIAEEDLRLRGPGEMLSTRQHGLPDLRVADLLTDGDLLRMAQRDAADLLRADPGLTHLDHSVLRRVVADRFGKRLSLMLGG